MSAGQKIGSRRVGWLTRQPVKPKRRFEPPAGGITFDQVAAPGRAGMSVTEYWKKRSGK